MSDPLDFSDFERRLKLNFTNPFEDFTIAVRNQDGLREASSVPFWGDFPATWERVYIAGKVLPGVCSVRGAGYKRRADKKRIAGEHGERMTDTGHDCAEVEITCQLYTQKHLEDFQKIIKSVVKRVAATKTTEEPQFVGFTDARGATVSVAAGTKKVTTGGEKLEPGPVDVVHPALVIFRIKSVQIMEVSLPESKGKDVFEVKLKCREFIPAAKASVTSNQGSKSSLGGNALDDRIAEKRAALARPSSTAAQPVSRGASGSW